MNPIAIRRLSNATPICTRCGKSLKCEDSVEYVDKWGRVTGAPYCQACSAQFRVLTLQTCVDCGDFLSVEDEHQTCKKCVEEEEQRLKDWANGIIHDPKPRS